MRDAAIGLLGVVLGAAIGYFLTPRAARKIRRQEREENAMAHMSQTLMKMAGQVHAFLDSHPPEGLLDTKVLHTWWAEVDNILGEFLEDRWAIVAAKVSDKKLNRMLREVWDQLELCRQAMGFSGEALEHSLFGEASVLSEGDDRRVREQLAKLRKTIQGFSQAVAAKY